MSAPRKDDTVPDLADPLDFIENAAVPLHSVGSDGTILWANQAELDLLGYSREEYVGRLISEFHVDAPVIADLLRRLSAGEVLRGCDARLRAKDGSIKHVLVSSSIRTGGDGLWSTRCYTVDVTDRKLREQAVSLAAARTETLLRITGAIASAVTREDVFEALVDQLGAAMNASSIALWLTDGDPPGTARLARQQGYSDAARDRLLTLQIASAPAMPVIDSIRTRQPVWVSSQKEMLERYPHLGQIATPGREYRVVCLPLTIDDRILGSLGLTIETGPGITTEERELLVVVSRYATQAVERLRLLESERESRAITDRSVAKLEDALRQNELFAGILAHDLRNPLGAITMAAQLLMRRHGQTDAARRPVERILASGDRMMRMIEQLLDFTRARSGGGIRVVTAPANLGAICRDVVEELQMLSPEWDVRQTRNGDLAGEWDVDRLQQVVSNLVSNAGVHGRAGAPILVDVDGRHRDHVELTVRNGGSIPESVLPRLFDPFWGTRRDERTSRGLGLGLFITREIVVAHGGTIEVRSTPEDGTCFQVQLPRAAALALPLRAATKPQKVR